MPRRIDVELTSVRDDGTWTWRAAGAKQPKGVLDGAVLYEGAQVGDVVRADAEFEVDGITIVAVLPPKAKRAAPTRLEVVGSGEAPEGVTTNLVGPADRPRDRDRGRRERGPREERDRGERGRGAGARRERDGRREGGDRPAAGARERPPRSARPERPSERDTRPERPSERGARPERRARPERSSERPETPARPKPTRLRPGRSHRESALAALSPEERPVAERVLRGGIPAVRQAMDEQNAKARAEGQPEVKADALVAMAEALLPRLRVAEWLDRAEAAAHDLDTVALRDLRAVVTGAEGVARDDASRSLAATLRAALERRAEQEGKAWLDEVRAALEEGRVVRALRISARPPDTGLAFPADLTARLTAAAGEALTAEASVDRWTALLDALAWSPVRAAVEPAGVPPEPDPALKAAVTKLAGRLPAIAARFGIEAPPPSAARGSRPGATPRRPRRGGGKSPAATGRRRPAPTLTAPEASAAPPAEGDSFADAVAAAALSLGDEEAARSEPTPDSSEGPPTSH